jgi:hypothetical protein
MKNSLMDALSWEHENIKKYGGFIVGTQEYKEIYSMQDITGKRDTVKQIMNGISQKDKARRTKRSNLEWGKKIIFALKTISVLLVSIALYLILNVPTATDFVSVITLIGLFILGLLTAIVFLSGDVYPKSLWGRIELSRQKRSRNDQRFRIGRIVIVELWFTYFIIFCLLLRVFFFLKIDLISKSVNAIFFAIFTFIFFISIILISSNVKPRSLWGSMGCFIVNSRKKRSKP